MTKEELLAEIDRGYREWEATIEQVPRERLGEPGVTGAWSVKDIIAHVAWYEWWTAEFIRKRTWPVAPPHLDSPDMDVRNDAYFAERRHAPASIILEESTRWHAELVAAVASLSAEDFADSTRLGMPEGDEWRIEQLVAENSCRHYSHHAPAVRAWLAATPN